MATRPDTTTGTITFTAGSTAFTTSGVNMLTRGHLPGDTVYVNTYGRWLTIGAITGENSGNFEYPCPADINGTISAHIRFQPDGSRVAAQARNLIEQLGNGNLEAIAALDGSGGNKGVMLNGAGQAATFALSAFARTLLDDGDAATARGTLGAQANLGYTAANRAGETFSGNVNVQGDLTVTKSAGGHQIGIGKFYNPNGTTGQVTDIMIGQSANAKAAGKFGFYKTADDNTSGAYMALMGRNEVNASLFFRGDERLFFKDKEVVDMSKFTGNISSPGWMKLPNGLIAQWGTKGITAANVILNFPTAFPGGVYGVWMQSNFAIQDAALIVWHVTGVNVNGFEARGRAAINGGQVTTEGSGAFWFALGV